MERNEMLKKGIYIMNKMDKVYKDFSKTIIEPKWFQQEEASFVMS